MGTLNGALEAREIRLDGDAIRATVSGTNEVHDRVPVLTRIHVRYTLRTPAGTRETVERALSRHASRCPTAMSLKGAVDVTWEAAVDEAGERWEMEGTRDV
ncbi:MAG TPA: OsmC family protein [Longimicrobiales bacterium]|nr:OsmC family protein [Longimicrobiales bacterium]